MIKVVSSQSMQDLDAKTITQYKIPATILMENAGRSSFEVCQQRGWFENSLVVFLIGLGNNGGDGLVMARHLAMHYSNDNIILITSTSKKLSQLNKLHREILQKLKLSFIKFPNKPSTQSSLLNTINQHPQVILVDALLGIGGTGMARGDIAKIINWSQKINSNKVVSLDIPSGIFLGFNDEPSIKANLTLTFGLPKDILFYPHHRPLVGELQVINPGFPKPLINQIPTSFHLVTPKSIKKYYIEYASNDYKKTRGHIGVLAGSKGTLGAAILAVKAIWKSGSGLVTLFAQDQDHDIQSKKLTNSMVRTYEELPYRLNDFDCFLVGPGLGRNHLNVKYLQIILDTGKPTVIDADGIYLLKIILKNQKKTIKSTHPIILTPHPGELAHLIDMPTEKLLLNPFLAIETFLKKYPYFIILLKSHINYLFFPNTKNPKKIQSLIIEGNNPYLGVGGSGDVLAGIMASRVAYQINKIKKKQKPHDHLNTIVAIQEAGLLACYIHQLAGKLAYQKKNIFTASELIKFIPQAIKSLTKI